MALPRSHDAGGFAAGQFAAVENRLQDGSCLARKVAQACFFLGPEPDAGAEAFRLD